MSQNSPGFSHPQRLAALHGKLALAGLVALLALCVSSTVFAGYPVTVVNNCSKTIHIRAGGNGAGAFHELEKVNLDPKAKHVYTVDAPYNNARVYGCWDTVAMNWDFYYDVNVQKHCALTEFTLSNVDGRIFTDVSFVDFISLPSRMELLGCKAGNPVSYCDSKDPTQPTKCRVTAQHTVDELKTCPTTLYTGMACESSYQFCKHSPGNPKCKKFDDNIRKCANNTISTSNRPRRPGLLSAPPLRWKASRMPCLPRTRCLSRGKVLSSIRRPLPCCTFSAGRQSVR